MGQKYRMPTADELFSNMLNKTDKISDEILYQLAKRIVWGSYSDPKSYKLTQKSFWDLDEDHIKNILLTQTHISFATKYILFWVREQKIKNPNRIFEPIDVTEVESMPKMIGLDNNLIK